jgi:arylsulfatase A-like enzyme
MADTAPDGLNIVVIVSDTFRYDHIGANGNGWIKTPELDAFARRAAAFDNCYVSSFPTIPMRTDWFTGRYGFPFYGWKPLDPQATVIAPLLARAGYINQLIIDTPHMMRGEYHFDRGFHGATWIRGQEGDTPMTWMNHPVLEKMPNAKTRHSPKPFGGVLANVHAWQNHHRWHSEEDRFVAQTCRAACLWLEHNYRAERFFLWVDCFDVHEPWDPPEYLVALYDPDYRGVPMFHPNYGPATDYTPEELRNLRAHYAGECTLVSKHVGRVLRMIEDVGIMDRTAVFLMSDHGMYLGEHNRTGKSNIHPRDDRGSWPLYREVSHIPLFVYVPGLTESGQPRRIAQLVQAPDVMPTVLELAGVEWPEALHGMSLVPLLRGQTEGWGRTIAVTSSVLQMGRGRQGAKVSVTDGAWSLVLGQDGAVPPELYDLSHDPGETQNAAADNKDKTQELREACHGLLRTLGADEEKIRSVE